MRIFPKTKFELNLFADYFQFYIQDEKAEGNLADSWTNEAVERLFAVAPGTIGIGTVRNMDVPVSLEILKNEPSLNPADWEHIVESSIEARSGKLVIAGCTDYFPDAQRIRVKKGVYKVRACYCGLNTLSEDRLDGSDFYQIQLWPAEACETVVRKSRVV